MVSQSFCTLVMRDLKEASGGSTFGGRISGSFSPGSWRISSYSDRKGSVVDLEVNFPKDVDLVWPAAFIGMNMSILNEKATKEERGTLFERLISNAVSEKFELIKFGNYDWTSGKNG